MTDDTHELVRFLVEAKRATYASQGGKVASPRKGAKDLAYQAGRYSYVDSYFGERDFSGQEVVYRDGDPFWSMNYYGWMLRDQIPVGFIETLREALLMVAEDRPYRGSPRYRRGSYEYTCRSEGTIDSFDGQESITYDGQEVYRLRFHGGRVR
jgi:hypothetical protein